MKLNMSFKKLGALLLIAGGILAIASCKKDEEEVLPYLEGKLSFNTEMFVLPDQTVVFTPKGITHPEGKGIGYYWTVTPAMNYNDTTRFENGLDSEGRESDGSFSFQFRDTLTTYTVTCVAFASGYNTTPGKTYTTVVREGLNGSLSGTGILPMHKKVTVDGYDYYYVSYNGLDWMRNNLANKEAGAPYMNYETVSSILGRFYSYEEALNACPEGWRLPTDKEWIELAAEISGKETVGDFREVPDVAAALMANAKFNLKEMWPYWPEVGEITNASGIAAVPAGYANLGNKVEGRYPSAAFKGVNEYAAFWTSDKVEGKDEAYYRYLICDQPNLFISAGDTKTFGANVRCVRESIE